MVGAHSHIVIVFVVGEFIGLDGRVGIQRGSSVTMLFPKRCHYNGFHTLAGHLIGKIGGGRAAVVLIPTILAHRGRIDLYGYGLMVEHPLFAGVQGRLVVVVVGWKHLVGIRLLDWEVRIMIMVVLVVTPLLLQQSPSLCASVVTMMMMVMMVPMAMAVVMVRGDHTAATAGVQSGLGGIIALLPSTAAAACLLTTCDQALLLGIGR